MSQRAGRKLKRKPTAPPPHLMMKMSKNFSRSPSPQLDKKLLRKRPMMFATLPTKSRTLNQSETSKLL
jgi:hypothetical protein